MRRVLSASTCAVLLSLGALPVFAQYDEDDTMRDHERQDARYYERYRDDDGKKDEAVDPTTAEIEEFLALADEAIRDRNYRADSSDLYRVQSDDPRFDTQAAVALLGAFRGYFETFWTDRTQLAPYEDRSRVFLFYSFYKFNKLLTGDWKFRQMRPQGHYREAFDVITLHTDAGDPAFMAGALVHEAAHQLVARRIFTEGGRPSIWLSEGLASYFGYTLLDATGTFRTGEVGSQSAILYRGVKVKPSRSSQMPKRLIRLVRDSLANDEEGDRGLLETLVGQTSADEFYGSRAPLNYGASWLLVHYLFHGDDGAHAEDFVRYLELEAGGGGGPDVFFRETGLSRATLDRDLAGYAKQLKVR
ncbi:MAG: DUF1570 domain-containing protein [bacterium]|nr:DUF1570 domain-containing protein [bacterium]